MNKKIKELARDEISLLLFFETIAADHKGVINEPNKMNYIDFGIALKWDKEGFINFKRYSFDNYKGQKVLTHKIKLTDEAINLAHQLRKERIKRNENK